MIICYNRSRKIIHCVSVLRCFYSNHLDSLTFSHFLSDHSLWESQLPHPVDVTERHTKELRPPARSQVSAPSWKRIFRSQSFRSFRVSQLFQVKVFRSLRHCCFPNHNFMRDPKAEPSSPATPDSLALSKLGDITWKLF